MTQFIYKNKKKKTVLKILMNHRLEAVNCTIDPNDFDVVKYIRSDRNYGDIFIAWHEKSPDETYLLFGEKGEDFGEDDYIIKPDLSEVPTSFSKRILARGFQTTYSKPGDYDYVEYLGSSINYGDVFKAWNDGADDAFVIYMGTKGHEFNP